MVQIERQKIDFCNNKNNKFYGYRMLICIFFIDTNISIFCLGTLGKQLLALLAHDLSSENAKNILRKNAFALMRLRR